MQPAFEIRHEARVDDGTVVSVRGDIDLFTTPEFKAAVSAAAATGTGPVILDLTATTFMDSSSLGVLIHAHRRLERQQRALVVACDQPAVLKVLRITGLDGVLNLIDDVPDPASVNG